MRRYLSSSLLFTFSLPIWASAAGLSLPGAAAVKPISLPSVSVIAPVVLPALPSAGGAILPGAPLPLPISLPTRLPSPLSRPTPIKVEARRFSAAGPVSFFDWSFLDDGENEEGLEDSGDLVPLDPKPTPRAPAGAAKKLVFSSEKPGKQPRVDGSQLFDGARSLQPLTLKTLVAEPVLAD